MTRQLVIRCRSGRDECPLNRLMSVDAGQCLPDVSGSVGLNQNFSFMDGIQFDVRMGKGDPVQDIRDGCQFRMRRLEVLQSGRCIKEQLLDRQFRSAVHRNRRTLR